MYRYNSNKGLPLHQLSLLYESSRGGINETDVIDLMRDLVFRLKESVRLGIEGTEYKDRILGNQSGRFKAKMEEGNLLESDLLNSIILCVTALMEVKSSMGVIVAAPTAGACGTFPGSCLGAAPVLNSSDEQLINAFLAGGIIGVFIAAHSTFAAEIAGCQAECGSAAGMAAAALVTLGNGTLDQAIAAASMALQNSFGLVCDPVANRVEVPCLGKNVAAAANALSCANMALAGYDAVIPLDEVIEAMDQVGKSLPCELRCTALGGLSITPTSLRIQQELEGRHSKPE
jgi:L-serine dehydratase